MARGRRCFHRIALACLLALPGFVVFAGPVQATGCEPTVPTTCTLRELAELHGLRIGATAEDFETTDSAYSATLASEFNSLTPENALKMYTIENTDDGWNFAPGDTVVDYALAHGMTVRGHTLAWAQDQYTPAWVKAITNPATLQSELDEYITTVMTHFAGRVRRWDVVNEPLATLSTGYSNSVFTRKLGTGWIANAFQLAHSLDPAAELWLNEYGTDWVPGKHDALLALVRDLVDAGVPIDGVGIQTHRLPGSLLDRTRYEQQLRDFTDLGLDVAITELDVPTSPTDTQALTKQAVEYADIVDACLAVVRCREITTWGVTDLHTWLDTSGLFPTPTRPLMFDNSYQPKPAYDVVRTDLAAAVTGAHVGIGSASVLEGGTGTARTIAFAVTLSRPALRRITVEYQLIPLTASAPADFSAFGGAWRTLTFNVSNGKTPTVTYVQTKVVPDTADEADEVFAVVLRNAAGGYALTRRVAAAKILDDDPGRGVRAGVGDSAIVEGDAANGASAKNAAKISVSLSAPADTSVSVTVTVAPGSAASPSDFSASRKTVTFSPGQVQKFVTVAVVPDTIAEGDESVNLALSNPTGGALLGRASGMLTILDDDA